MATIPNTPKSFSSSRITPSVRLMCFSTAFTDMPSFSAISL